MTWGYFAAEWVPTLSNSFSLSSLASCSCPDECPEPHFASNPLALLVTLINSKRTPRSIVFYPYFYRTRAFINSTTIICHSLAVRR